ncbi:MAG: endonuclease NucS [Chloroflexota bacterium]|nr:endonuclease NucS [Chloroflexota bacterium]
MEETKIWSIEGTAATPLNTTNHIETEGLLESILTANPDMLEEGLQLVGRQTSTAGGPLDLLGVDNYGRLVVFELKRGTLTREAVAQVLDYASSLDSMDLDSLTEHITERSGKNGIEKIEDFEQWYSDIVSSEGLDSLKPPRMVLVGLGTDNTTERMVNYMIEGGMDISLLTFYGFESDGKTLLARHAEANTSDAGSQSTHGTPSHGLTRAERIRSFVRRATMSGVSPDILDAMRKMIEGRLPVESATKTQLTYRFKPQGGQGAYVYLYIEPDQENKGIKLGFNPVAVRLLPDKFKQLPKEDIPFEKENAKGKNVFGEFNYEIKFPISSSEEWDDRKDRLTTLTQSVYSAYQKSQSD